MSRPSLVGRISTEGVALRCGKPFLWVARLHASSAILASDSVALATASWIRSIRGLVLTPGGILTLISSHIHCPAVEKLKYFPRIAYPFKKEINRSGRPFVVS